MNTKFNRFYKIKLGLSLLFNMVLEKYIITKII